MMGGVKTACRVMGNVYYTSVSKHHFEACIGVQVMWLCPHCFLKRCRFSMGRHWRRGILNTWNDYVHLVCADLQAKILATRRSPDGSHLENMKRHVNDLILWVY